MPTQISPSIEILCRKLRKHPPAWLMPRLGRYSFNPQISKNLKFCRLVERASLLYEEAKATGIDDDINIKPDAQKVKQMLYISLLTN